ncbi:MAG: EAL domain-containing protein [Gammaproteobacteria bacterium]|nr:EAL domain-containing protein [Gammaproteobacteria bacterium]
MMTPKVISIRQRFLVIMSLFVGILLVATLYTSHQSKDSIKKQYEIAHRQNHLSDVLSLLSENLLQLGVSIYQKSFISDHIDQKEIHSRILRVRELAAELEDPSNVALQERIQTLRATLDVIFDQVGTLLTVQKDVEKRFLAMPIMLNDLRPANVDFMTAVVDGLNDLRVERGNDEASELFRDIRYEWSQLISSVRVFVANRLGAFGPPELSMEASENNRKVYAESVALALVKLETLKKQGRLGIVQENAVERMRKAFDVYNVKFKQVQEIYYSETWRADHSLMRDGIDPMLNTAIGIVNDMRAMLSGNVVEGISLIEESTATFSETMWLVLALVLLVTFIAYIGFELLIRRPLTQIGLALVAEGEGKKFQPALSHRILETQFLIDALARMRSQVHARQLRLQSILDNAGEGILIIDKLGRIESLNKAAEIVFGMDEAEIVGKGVTTVIPAFESIRNHKDAGMMSVLKNRTTLHPEQEIEGVNSKMESFPMSIRLGRVLLEGEILYVALVSDISERKAMVDRLKQLAERDSLTGLYNRHFFIDELDRAIERNLRNEKLDIALLYLDLDNFKYVNDTLGHVAGDKVLTDVSDVLINRARGTDLVVRLGGDEFAILLYNSSAKEALVAAEAYRRHLSEFIFNYEGQILDIGCSIGIALLDGSIKNKEEILLRADLACHIAKRLGRNRVYFFEEKDKQSADAMSLDMGWARRIKNSIENNLFVMDCQPIMSLKSRQITSHEVLLRMKGENGDLIMPSGFLPSAERFGLIQEIDRWVIRHSMRHLMRNEGYSGRRYAINLSAKSIGDPEILELIQTELDRNAVNPNNVVFEVTESSAIQNINAAAEFLAKLQELGFKTALDDFGVGYSSFSYLKDLAVDIVKIDKSFVQNVTNDKVKRAIVASMNDVAHALGKETVAEFVEDRETVEFLASIGVDYCQGYYIGEPRKTIRDNHKDNIVYLN